MEWLDTVYRDFFATHLKKDQYIPGQDGFNPSILAINPDQNQYVISVRFLGTKEAYAGQEVIPGNYSKDRYVVERKMPKHVSASMSWGENFFWNQWLSDDLIDNTVFFVALLTNKGFVIDDSIKPIVIHNVPLGSIRDDVCKGKCKGLKLGDIRMFRDKDNRVICHDAYMSSVFELCLDGNTLKCALLDQSLFSTKTICFKTRSFDKNWAYIGQHTNGTWIFMDKFAESGVCTIQMSPDFATCTEEQIIKYKKDALGQVDLINGMFSLGTPFKRINESKTGYQAIALGHVKLSRTTKYKNPNVLKFVKSLQSLFKDDTKVILHASYHYLCFFMMLKYDKEGKASLHISDAFLVAPETPRKYTFTINYPIGIESLDQQIIVTMGIGDYYTSVCHWELQSVLDACVHDVSAFDSMAYDYFVLPMSVRS
jgi:hypothetical protein